MTLKKLFIYTLLTGFIAFPVYAKKEHQHQHQHQHQHEHQHQHPTLNHHQHRPLPSLKHQRLPPGLKMKTDKGGSLPPGWKKKLAKGAVLDKSIYDQGKVIKAIDSKGIITVKVDDKVVRLYKTTREIVDILE